MCANCVAQGAVYVGGAVAGLQVMAARARRRLRPGAVPAPDRRSSTPTDAAQVGGGIGDRDDPLLSVGDRR